MPLNSAEEQIDFNPFASTPRDEDPRREIVNLGDAFVRPTPEAYDELQRAYDFFNEKLFAGVLPHCLITLQREKRSFGYFQETTFVRRTGETSDEIAVNPRYFATRSIRETLSGLVHDMVHLWQHHYGIQKSRKGYHNKEWGDHMEKIGLMPSATGQPEGTKTGDRMSHYIIAGGAFDTACTQLITDAFNLSWMDRHPMPTPQLLLPPDSVAAAGMQLPTPTELAEVKAAEKYVILPAQPEGSRRPTGGSNRLKYRCPSCATQVWGKPGLALLCGQVACGNTGFEVVR